MIYSNATILETLHQTEGTYPVEPDVAGKWAVPAVNNTIGALIRTTA
jgi:hypothetical protein